MSHPVDHMGNPAARHSLAAEYAALSARDQHERLGVTDLERLGFAAFLTGHDPAGIDALTRAHTVALESGDSRQAARAAFWVAFGLIGARELTRASGWTARARRLLEEGHHDCAESGYVLLPQALAEISSGNLASAQETFGAAERIGERFGDPSLTSLARQGRGRVLIGLGRIAEGVALFDEAMVAVTAGEVMPIVSGVVYCSVVSACFDLCDIGRAQEWTDALNEWCEAQPGLVSYRGECLAHRAEILRLHGRWPEALAEARGAYEALPAAEAGAKGSAAYLIAELHRLRGQYPEAEEAYRLASEHGREPHPGLALLRIAQGQSEAARVAIERVLAEPSRGRRRAEMLVAAVEILLGSGDAPRARRAADELNTMADAVDTRWLRAMAASAGGAVQLAEGRARESLEPMREALTIWRDLDAPYEAARISVLLGCACRALGDADGARMEWAAAIRVFHKLGAAPALREVQALTSEGSGAHRPDADALTQREVQVLRLIARGKTNRAIAGELDISEKTVARHVSNIFVKLDVSSRSAATAYAFTHRLVS